MSTNWTIQNTSTTGETQWMNVNYIDITVADNATGETDFIEIAGYTAGSISFTLDSSPSSWLGGSSLDVSIQTQILNLLNKLQEKYKLSYIFISHDMKVIKAVSDYILVLKNGKVIEQGNINLIFNKPQQTYTQNLLQAVI